MSRPTDVLSNGISARLLGGLGNQLFIYAAALAQAERLKVPLTLLSNHSAGSSSFSLELDSFKHAGCIIQTRESPSRWWRAVNRGTRRRTNLFVETSFEYDAEIEQVQPGVELRGYFQSWRYFTKIEERLRSDLLDRTPATPWLTDWSHRVAAEGRTIAIHVRR